MSIIIDDRKFEGMHQYVFWNNKFFSSEDVEDEDMHIHWVASSRNALASNPPELEETPKSGVIASHAVQLNKLFKKLKSETGPYNIVLYSRDGGIQLQEESLEKGYRTKQGYCITFKIDEGVETLNRIPKSVSKIFCSNISVSDSRLICVPYGASYGCAEEIYKRAEDFYPRKRDLCYANFNIRTNRKHRVPIWNKMVELGWVDVRSSLTTEEYIDDLFSYKYVVCPKGNGIDTMRMWETLYCGAIPIVPRSGVSSHFNHILPIVEVDHWNLDKEYLEAI